MKNIILEKSFRFSLDIIDLHQILNNQKHFVISKQVLRSGTSIGANIREAQRAESKADFIHKLSIALKEADETKYWLELIENKIIAIEDKLKQEIEEIIKLLVSIINSSKNKN